MKPVFTAISAVLLAGGLGIGAAQALPRIEGAGTTSAAPADVEKARVVCNYRRCFRTGGYYLRPYRYGYYGPRYYRPGIGIGIGPFGVGIY